MTQTAETQTAGTQTAETVDPAADSVLPGNIPQPAGGLQYRMPPTFDSVADERLHRNTHPPLFLIRTALRPRKVADDIEPLAHADRFVIERR